MLWRSRISGKQNLKVKHNGESGFAFSMERTLCDGLSWPEEGKTN